MLIKKNVCIISLLLSFLPLAAEKPSEILPELQHNFTIIQNAHNLNLDPHTSNYSSEAQILGNLFEGLFSYDPATLAPLPAIAESYKISRNKRRWTFTIRENAMFSNGVKITADSVRTSWLKLLANPKAIYSSLFDIISGAEEFRTGKGSASDVGIIAKDSRTLVVQLKAPASHFNRILCHHAFSVVYDLSEIYSGPFVISEQNENKLLLSKNEYYWDKESVHIPSVTILLSDELEQNTFAFNTGSADWVCNAISMDQVLVKNAVQINAEFGTQYLFFKSSKAPWNNPEFRIALLTAVPWAELRKNYLIRAETFIYPLYGYPAVTGFSETDEDEALELMKEARKKAGIIQDQPLELSYGVIENSYIQKQAELLRKAWEPLGVNLVIQEKSAAEYLNAIPDWEADLFNYTWIGDFSDPLAFLELFRGNSTLNVSKYSNAEFDRLLDEAAADESENHLKLLAKAEQLLLDEGMIIPISHPVSLNAVDLEAVGGWSANSLDVHPFKYLYFKEKSSKIPNLVKLIK